MGTTHDGIARRYAYACQLEQRGTEDDLRQAFITFDQVIDLAVLRYLRDGCVSENLLKKYGGDIALRNDRRNRQNLLGDVLATKNAGVARADLRDLQLQRNRFYHEDADVIPSAAMLAAARSCARVTLKILFDLDIDVTSDRAGLDSLFKRRGTQLFASRTIPAAWSAYKTLKGIAQYFDAPSAAGLSVESFQEEWNLLSALNDNLLSPLNTHLDRLIQLVQRVSAGLVADLSHQDADLIRKTCAQINDSLGHLECISIKVRADAIWGIPSEISQLLLRIKQGLTLEAYYSDGESKVWEEEDLGSDVLVNAPEPFINKVQAKFGISESDLYVEHDIQARFGLLNNRDLILSYDRDVMMMAYADLWHRE